MHHVQAKSKGALLKIEWNIFFALAFLFLILFPPNSNFQVYDFSLQIKKTATRAFASTSSTIFALKWTQGNVS